MNSDVNRKVFPNYKDFEVYIPPYASTNKNVECAGGYSPCFIESITKCSKCGKDVGSFCYSNMGASDIICSTCYSKSRINDE